ncbi:hypothetical protein HanPSC8_Chr05g0204061 [Helianthus annuus]|nr:hypothetical protein HanPSC8_Chr05g0204061 [Helianthus annuus]
MKYFLLKSKKINFFWKTPKANVTTTICITIFSLENPQSTPRVAAGRKTVSNSTNVTQPSSTTDTDST